jgi:predicted naringenin-chalcone synthase
MCTGSLVVLSGNIGRHGINVVVVDEVPKEVHELMQETENAMLELHHHADPEVAVYVNLESIVAIDARWDYIEEE